MAAQESACVTSEVSLSFDFAGASPARCVIEGARSFTLVIGPEHAPPINPSPWYAFRYDATGTAPVRVRLAYLEAVHRYAPKLIHGPDISALPVDVDRTGRSAVVTLPAGEGIVAAQPLLTAAHFAEFDADMARRLGAERLAIGTSLDGRPIEGLRFGRADAPHAVLILGRQHPPEVTGSYALEPFVEALAESLGKDAALAKRLQVIAVPLLNPDGVERGHWRANRGGVDLNRDWGPFSQPETRAVRDWLAREAPHTTPIAMLDFHSTRDSLFYVQGEEASAPNRRFLDAFLGGKERAFAGYPFAIEPRNANPGSGTAKNWFFECFAIPSYTYEVGDDVDRAATAAAAQVLAGDFLAALRSYLGEDRRQAPNCLRGGTNASQTVGKGP